MSARKKWLVSGAVSAAVLAGAVAWGAEVRSGKRTMDECVERLALGGSGFGNNADGYWTIDKVLERRPAPVHMWTQVSAAQKLCRAGYGR